MPAVRDDGSGARLAAVATATSTAVTALEPPSRVEASMAASRVSAGLAPGGQPPQARTGATAPTANPIAAVTTSRPAPPHPASGHTAAETITPVTAMPVPPASTARQGNPVGPRQAPDLASLSQVVRAVDPERIRAAIQARLTDLPCSRLVVATDESSRTVVRGRVGSPEQLLQAREAIAELSPGVEPALAVEIVGGPFCRVLDQVEAIGDADGPGIMLNRPDATFTAGDFVVATIAVPPDLERGHLNVMFVDHTGKVVHLLPNAFVHDTEVQGGQTVRLGVEANERRAGVRDYQVTPPYGRGMMLALWSPVPLDGLGLNEVERVEDLLPALASALAKVPHGRVHVSRADLVTRP